VSNRIVVTLTARTDAVETFRWIAEQSPDAAARWYAGFQKAIAKLSRNPERHPVAEEESELAGITLRQMLYGRRRGIYRILFSIQEETVTVHSVRHSARGPIDGEGSGGT
jgi:plasmid stabilization system protein ParE